MPDTTGYLTLGLVMVLGVLGFYIFSLGMRLHSARKEAAVVQHIIDEP